MAVPVGSEQVDRFRELVGERLGLHVGDGDLGSAAAVLQARLAAENLAPDAYLERLASPDAADLSSIAEAFAVHETYFFRNAEHIDVLLNVAVPAWLLRTAAQRPLRILSAGCATGEEAYSVAIALQTPGVVRGRGWHDIRAVDLVPGAIEHARRARYSRWALRDARSDLVERWFRRSGKEFVLDDEIRHAVSFRVANLAADDPAVWTPGGYDVVFCRNVLMYFTPKQARAVVARIGRSLVPAGHLFLGYAETLRGLSDDFHLRHSHGAFYYERKDVGKDAGGDMAAASRAPSRASSRLTKAEPSAVPSACWFDSIRMASDRVEALACRAAVARDAGASAALDEHLAAAVALLDRERFADALQELAPLPETLSKRPDVLLLRAVLLLHDSRLEEAETTSLELLGKDPSNAGAQYVLGLCREGVGDLDGAMARHEAATRLDPAFSMPRLHLGLLARKHGRRHAARSELATALALLEHEDDLRLRMFGGGFGRDALLTLCRTELEHAGGAG